MKVSTPGRICLFGEHQDYLGLPVIAMAISLRATIQGEKCHGNKITIHKPEMGETESFNLEDLSYTKPRDYFKSGLKVCQKAGLTFSRGIEAEITSNIPFKAGCSSSSAIMVSWILFLSQIADNPIEFTPIHIANLAYQAEILEFNEPGGMMDQYSTALGGLIYLESEPKIKVDSLPNLSGKIILGDSLEEKQTLDILHRCKNMRHEIIKKISLEVQKFNLHSIDIHEIDRFENFLDKTEIELLHASLQNRDFLKTALSQLQTSTVNPHFIGKLLNEHHRILRDVLQVSTPRINSMLNVALDAGALGGKINGSGGGGCMFAYATENESAIAEAIENVGGKAYIVHSDQGSIKHG